jgi:hypothetical protein
LRSLAVAGLVAVATVAIAGCTTTSTVHVFGKYLTGHEKQKVSEVLRQRDYEVEINHLDFPDAINSDAVIYSPMHSKPAQVEALMALVIGELNAKAQLLFIRSDQHSYNKDNIGLYLFGQAGGKPKRDERINFTSPYSASHCHSLIFAEVILAPDHTFELITIADSTADEVLRKGRWQRQNQQLSLFANDKLIAIFDVQYTSAQTIVDGLRKSILLSPIEGQAAIDQCRFSYSIVLRG